MSTAPLTAFCLMVIAYFCGAIPFGFIAGKVLKGIDIREHDSGSTGATNVLRTLGKVPALTVLLLDIGKGVVAVGLVRFVYAQGWLPDLPFTWQPWLLVGAAIIAVLGHGKSVFINFTGGKSVATSLGVITTLNPWLGLGALLGFLGMVLATRIVSISSIFSAIVVIVLAITLQLPLPYLLFTITAGTYVIVRHRDNIERLLQGKEPKIGEKSAPTNDKPRQA